MKRYFAITLTILITAFFVIGCSKKHQTNSTVKLKSDGKFVVLIFDSTTCPYCKKLHRDLNNNPELKKLEKNMEIYTIHVDENGTYILPTKKGNLKVSSQNLARMYGFRGSTPYIVFCNSNFRPIVTIPGYLKPETLVKVFKYVLTRAYQTMSINEYLSTP